MPTYTYRCGNCDLRFDLVQGFNDPDPNTCPNCGVENDLKRIYKPVGVVFKGSGFYATDNKSGKSSSVLSSNGSKPEKADTPSESPASDSKESPKPEKKTSEASSDAP